jgi:hypothetical protein
MSGPKTIQESKDFYDEIKIPDKCSFSEGWLCSLGTA